MTIDYAGAGDILDRYGRAWEAFDGDAWVELFTDDIEYHHEPFEPPLVPFGVFLAPAAMLALLWGQSLIDWYLHGVMGL